MPTEYNTFNCLYNNPANCSSYDLGDARTHKATLDDVIQTYLNANDFKGNFTNRNNEVARYNIYHAYNDLLSIDFGTIQTDYANMKSTRDKIDNELAELHGIDASKSNDVQNKLDTTMLSGVLWTTLAVTLVYFAFRKL